MKINAHLKSSLEKKRRVEKWENMMHLGFKNEFPSFIMGGNYFKRRKRGKIQNCLGVKILSSFARLFFLKVVHQLSKNVIPSVWQSFSNSSFSTRKNNQSIFGEKKGWL